MTHAIRFHQAGARVLVWRKSSSASPAREARIRHTAVGLNFVDIYNRSGLYPVQLRAAWAARGLAWSRKSDPASPISSPATASPTAPRRSSLCRRAADSGDRLLKTARRHR